MLLILDIGTSSMRAVLMDKYGTLCGKVQHRYPLLYPCDGGVEMDLAELDAAMIASLREVGELCRKNGWTLEGISVSAQRSSVIPMGTDGKAMAHALMWQDRRCAYILDQVRENTRTVFEICGMRPSPVFSAPKMCYLRDRIPEIYEKAEKLIGFQEYVLHYLTGEYATDTSIASRTCLYDLKADKWSDELIDLFGLDRRKLCKLVPVGSVIGQTLREIDNLLELDQTVPVISAGGDQQCAALGMGCGTSKDLACNLGTGAYTIATVEKPLIDPQMRVNCNVSAIQGNWILEGSVLSAGRTVDWFCDLFYPKIYNPVQMLFQEASQSSPGARGLRFINHLTGAGTPRWDPTLRAEFQGIDSRHGRADFARAVLEGIARDIRACVDSISALSGQPYPEIRTAGGLTRSAFFNQMVADMIGRTVVLADESEATSVGAWRVGMLALGHRLPDVASGGKKRIAFVPNSQ